MRISAEGATVNRPGRQAGMEEQSKPSAEGAAQVASDFCSSIGKRSRELTSVRLGGLGGAK